MKGSDDLIIKENEIIVEKVIDKDILKIDNDINQYKNAIFFDLEHYVYKKPKCVGVFGSCFFDEQKAKLAAARLEEAGIFAPPYYYPAVGLDEAEVRLNLVYGHTQEHLCKVLEVLEKVGKETGVIHFV